MGDDSTFDSVRAEAFAGSLLETLNAGALCLMLSIGHRVGLFDAMSSMAPATSHAIADNAGLDERYVREWLGAMVTARVVEVVDHGPITYRLPAEHSAFLTRPAGADNIAVFMQYIGVMGDVEDAVVECFRNGGGVPYERYPRFHEVMAEDSGQSVLAALESHIVPIVPGLHERLQIGIDVLDLGCGQGQIIQRLAELYPPSRFIGIDLSTEATTAGRESARRRGLNNVEFIQRDLSDFDRTAPAAAFDLITTFDAVHDQARPLNLLKGIHRALRDDGTYLMQDIKGSSFPYNNLDHAIGTFLYSISCMHCMTVSLAQGGEGLGAMWGEEKTNEYLALAGFGSVDKREFDHDIQNNWYVVTK